MYCSRKNCNNLCDIHIPLVGNICDECMVEFKQYFETKFDKFTVPHAIEVELKSFFKSDKSCVDRRKLKIDVESYFKLHKKK